MASRRVMSRAASVLFGAIVLAALGCGDILGFQDSVVVRCILPSDCGDKRLNCIDGVCTPTCVGDLDCIDMRYPPGTICDNGACVTPDEKGDRPQLPPEAACLGRD